MMKTAQSLVGFFSQFEYPVYLETDVPDEAELPYITIPLKDPEWRRQVSYQALVWDRTESNYALIAKADEIAAEVGEGVRIPFDGGLLVLRMDTDTPTQMMVQDDFRCARVAMVLNAYHLPGV